MSDRMTIVGKDGGERYLIDEFDQVTDLLPPHEHKFTDQDLCLVCLKTRKEVEESNE